VAIEAGQWSDGSGFWSDRIGKAAF
jgi:hypothetical protein